MKMDIEASDEVFELKVTSEKCRVITEDLRDMLNVDDEKLIYYKERTMVYAEVILDYVLEIDKKLDKLNQEHKLIKKSPAPTKAQGETATITV